MNTPLTKVQARLLDIVAKSGSNWIPGREIRLQYDALYPRRFWFSPVGGIRIYFQMRDLQEKGLVESKIETDEYGRVKLFRASATKA